MHRTFWALQWWHATGLAVFAVVGSKVCGRGARTTPLPSLVEAGCQLANMIGLYV